MSKIRHTMPQEFFTVGSLFGLTSGDLFYKIAKTIIITSLTPNSTSTPKKAEKRSIRELAERLGMTETTIKTVRTEYTTKGFEDVLYRKKRVVSKISRKIMMM